jgi:integrase
MDRRISKLSALAVKSAKPGMHGDGGGLWLHVSGRGTRSWIFRFTSPIDGKPHEMGLGPLHTLSLADARIKAMDCRRQVLEGGDPLAARQARRQAARVAAVKTISFKECAESYIAAHEAGWRNPKHRGQWPATLAAYVYPIFGALPVAAIDTGLVMQAVQPLWAHKTETASRVRGRIESILDWATARGYRAGDNPARWRGHLENLLPNKSKVAPVAHHAALPFPEIAAFVAELRQHSGAGARALEFLILTAARTGEVIGARWPEIDLEGRLWTVPAGRMKAGREHRVPLSAAALAILAALPRKGDFVFPGGRAGRPLSNMAMLQLLGRIGRGALTAHGFRSCFADWCAERTAFPAEVREMALAHTVSDKVEAAYRRGDLFEKRRQLAEAWAKFCTTPPAAGEVVPLRRAVSPA